MFRNEREQAREQHGSSLACSFSFRNNCVITLLIVLLCLYSLRDSFGIKLVFLWRIRPCIGCYCTSIFLCRLACSIVEINRFSRLNYTYIMSLIENLLRDDQKFRNEWKLKQLLLDAIWKSQSFYVPIYIIFLIW